MDNIYSDFAYDDAYRTAETECDDLLIPFVNYFHNENYDKDAEIIRNHNEYYIHNQDHSDEKRITDSVFEIRSGDVRKKYHYECESARYDDSILVRMFEYDMKVSVGNAEVGKRCIHVELPYSGILLLRGKGGFDKADVELITPGGSVRYPIAIRHMSDLNLDLIFEKHLYLLLPFVAFNYENRLNAINDSDEELEDFLDIYRDILRRMENDLEKGYLSAYSYGVIIRLIHKVMHKLTMNRENVQRRVGDIMGGKVLELDIVKARHEGIAKGIEQGIEKGIEQGGQTMLEKNIIKLAEDYMTKDRSLSREKAIEMARNILC